MLIFSSPVAPATDKSITPQQIGKLYKAETALMARQLLGGLC